MVAALLLACSWAHTQSVPFKEPFDEATVGPLHDQNSWIATPQRDANVQTGTVYGGTQGALMTTNALVSHEFSSPNATNVWIDYYARVPYPGDDADPVLTNSVAAAFFITSLGSVKAISNSTWVTISADGAIPENTWRRFTVHVDYDNRVWGLYVAGSTPNALSTTLATNLAFSASSTNTYLHRFRIKN